MFRFILIIFSSFLISSCDLFVKTKKYPVYRTIISEAEDEEDVCGCGPNRLWVLTNNHPTSDKVVSITTIIRNAQTRELISQNDDLESISKESSKILGCAIVGPNENPTCFRTVEYVVKDETAILKNTKSNRIFTTDLSSCQSICNNPASAYCYRAGIEAEELLFPVLALYEAAKKEGVKVVKKKDILDKYDLSDDFDKCNREDILISDSESRITNDSKLPDNENCISTNKLSPFSVRFPKKLEALANYSEVKTYSENNSIHFDNINLGPMISFDNIDNIEITNEYEKRFGGYIRSVSESDENIIISTTNGCIRIPK